MVNAKKSIKQKGQALVEYAFLLVLVCSVLLATLALVGLSIGNVFSSISDEFDSAAQDHPTPEPTIHLCLDQPPPHTCPTQP